MTNDRYLVISYFVSAGICLGAGMLVYFHLRRSLGAFADAAFARRLGTILKRLFPFGLLLPALMGFMSVTYLSCNHTTYEKIVESRKYLVEKNQEQLSSTLFSLAVAILVWDLVLIVVRKFAHKGENEL
jgi:hypothetical protein